MTIVAALVAFGLIAVVAIRAFGLQRSVIVFGLTCIVVRPVNFIGFGTASTMSHTTIAAGRVSISTHDVALLFVAVFAGLSVLRRFRLEFLIVAVASLSIAVLQSNLKPWVAEGILQWVFLGVCWAFGSAVSRAVSSGRLSERFVAGTLLLCVGLHALAACAQFAGFGRVYESTLAGGDLSRMTGLAGHPGNLGKIILLLMMLILPLSSSTDRTVRRLAWTALGLSLTTEALTFSRANVLATAVLFLGWMIFNRRSSTINRAAILASATVAAIPVVQILIERQQYDPDGGLRPALMKSAMIQLHETFWWGIGPNNYIEKVGQFDPYAAGGLPVHSTFVLMLVELGAIVAVVAAIPFVLIIIRAVRTAHANRGHAYAVGFLLSLPGLVIIMQTGHGMTSEVVAPTFFFAIGFIWSSLPDTNRAATESGDADSHTWDSLGDAAHPGDTQGAGNEPPSRLAHHSTHSADKRDRVLENSPAHPLGHQR